MTGIKQSDLYGKTARRLSFSMTEEHIAALDEASELLGLNRAEAARLFMAQGAARARKEGEGIHVGVTLDDGDLAEVLGKYAGLMHGGDLSEAILKLLSLSLESLRDTLKAIEVK